MRAYFYDQVIVWFTQIWYKSVIERLPQDAKVLDIGIGKAESHPECRHMDSPLAVLRHLDSLSLPLSLSLSLSLSKLGM